MHARRFKCQPSFCMQFLLFGYRVYRYPVEILMANLLHELHSTVVRCVSVCVQSKKCPNNKGINLWNFLAANVCRSLLLRLLTAASSAIHLLRCIEMKVFFSSSSARTNVCDVLFKIASMLKCTSQENERREKQNKRSRNLHLLFIDGKRHRRRQCRNKWKKINDKRPTIHLFFFFWFSWTLNNAFILPFSFALSSRVCNDNKRYALQSSSCEKKQRRTVLWKMIRTSSCSTDSIRIYHTYGVRIINEY